MSEKLIEWINKEAGEIIFDPNKLEIREDPEKGRGLYSKTYYYEGDVIMSIPQKFFISLNKAETDPIISKLIELSQELNINLEKYSILAMVLWQEMKLEQNSFFHEYFLLLPKEYTTLSTWNAEDSLFIERKKHKKLYEKLIEEYNQQYNNIITISKSFSKKNLCEELVFEKMLWKEYIYCISTIESRTFYYQCNLDPASSVGTMIPMLDMLNHMFNTLKDLQKAAYFSFGTGTYGLHALEGIKPGSELFLNYAKENNFHFLRYYGFVPEVNPHDTIDLTIDLFEIIKICQLDNIGFHAEIQKFIPHYYDSHQNKKTGNKKYQLKNAVTIFIHGYPYNMDQSFCFLICAACLQNPKFVSKVFEDPYFRENEAHQKKAYLKLCMAVDLILERSYQPNANEPKNLKQRMIKSYYEKEKNAIESTKKGFQWVKYEREVQSFKY